MSHDSARESVMLQVPDAGAFVRALLPVRLTGGDSVTFGVWVAIDPRNDALRAVASMWWDDAKYVDLQVDGFLANEIPPWSVLGSPVRAQVRDVNQTPYCESSADETLSRIIHEEWDHEFVLAALDGI